MRRAIELLSSVKDRISGHGAYARRSRAASRLRLLSKFGLYQAYYEKPTQGGGQAPRIRIRGRGGKVSDDECAHGQRLMAAASLRGWGLYRECFAANWTAGCFCMRFVSSRLTAALSLET